MAIRKWWLVFLGTSLLLASTPTVHFFIESIEITGQKTMPADVLLSHCLLSPKREYTENQLADALNRIRKLPFVYDCDFSLKKGSQRGRFILLIEIREVRNLTFGFQTPDHRDLLLSQRDPDQFDGVLLANWRILKRGKLEFYGTLGVGLRTRDEYGGGFESLGLIYYGLTGGRSFTSLEWTNQAGTNLRDTLDLKSNGGAERRTTIKHVHPLTGDHWLVSEAFVNHWKHKWSPNLVSVSPFLVENDSEGFGMSLGWTYNSADDAWIPNKGTVFNLGIDYRQEDTQYQRPFEWTGPELRQKNFLFYIDGKHYFQLSTRRVLAMSWGGMAGDSYYNLGNPKLNPYGPLQFTNRYHNDWNGYLGLDYSVKIYRKWLIFNDVRLITALADQIGDMPNLDSPYYGLVPGFHEFHRTVFSIGASSRNAWGIIRCHIRYSYYHSQTLDEFLEIPE